jgi:hypothetical protein
MTLPLSAVTHSYAPDGLGVRGSELGKLDGRARPSRREVELVGRRRPEAEDNPRAWQ